jgi:hypothetical protein
MRLVAFAVRRRRVWGLSIEVSWKTLVDDGSLNLVTALVGCYALSLGVYLPSRAADYV